MRVLAIPPEWCRRAIVIADAEVAEGWFTEEERRVANSFRLAKRRDEFFSSRAAAKNLAVELGLANDPVSVRIDERRIGSRFLSLSHSGRLSAAAIDEAPVGIDVQVVRDISENAAHLFLTDAEIETMRQTSIAHRMIHFWCAKEAAWKREGGRIETLRRVPLHLDRVRDDGLDFRDVETIAIDNVVVALTRRAS